MIRSFFLTAVFLEIALLISFFVAQEDPAASPVVQEKSDERIPEASPALNFHQPNGEELTATGIGTTVFNVSELKHYLCALEVKKRNEKEVQIQESAVACTKTIPEYLAEPGCK